MSGTGSLYTAASQTIQGYTAETTLGGGDQNEGLLTGSAQQNFWWDFAQTNIFTGQTQFGRGGGSTAPCGYWVFYAYEQPGPIQSASTLESSVNVQPGTSDAKVNMWTDNAITTTLGGFVLAGLASLLY